MTLKYGSKSNSKQGVRALRIILGLPIEDDYTLEVKNAVKAYQIGHGLDVDGIVGVKTCTEIANSMPDVIAGDYSGSIYVRAVQALVSTAIDGKYGKNTKANVTAFQCAAKIEASGNVDKNTWLALWDCEYTKKPVVPPSDWNGVNCDPPVDYKQGDSRWGKMMYSNHNDKGQTYSNSACGPTSMSDIMATWVDKNIIPPDMGAFAIEHNRRTYSDGTAWAFFKDVAQEWKYPKFVQTKSMATLRTALANGALAVASMGAGYWTKGGHFICVYKMDDTYVYARDPASNTRKKQKIADFEKQRKQFFIFYREA